MEHLINNIFKSNQESSRLRKAGNEHFKKAEFYEAMVYFSKSISVALFGSQELGMSYANRSAVYLECKLFKECLENIKLARKNGYPAGNMAKLNARETKCKQMMEAGCEDVRFNIWDFFKLSHPSNDKIPFIINCLELRENDIFGRHIITTKDLKTGDVIAIEEPFFQLTTEPSRLTHCSICLKGNNMNLIPDLNFPFCKY